MPDKVLIFRTEYNTTKKILTLYTKGGRLPFAHYNGKTLSEALRKFAEDEEYSQYVDCTPEFQYKTFKDIKWLCKFYSSPKCYLDKEGKIKSISELDPNEFAKLKEEAINNEYYELCNLIKEVENGRQKT